MPVMQPIQGSLRSSMFRSGRAPASGAAIVVGLTVALSACGSSDSAADTTMFAVTSAPVTAAGTSAPTTSAAAASTTAAPAMTVPTIAAADAAAVDTSAAVEGAAWGDNVTITINDDGTFTFESDGIPNHERQAEYALPDAGVNVPSADTASAGADPTAAQDYSFAIPTSPVKADEPTPASMGTIGIMISGAALFNPYEGDGATVAAASNFTVKNAAGDDVAFLDSCNGHPNPVGAYHYHALPPCVTAQVDGAGGPSHLIGVAFDGYPIYGPLDTEGNKLTAADLDECNGITSPTPEFPEGVYHYVLLNVADSTSSIRCFAGVVDDSLTVMGGMQPRGG